MKDRYISKLERAEAELTCAAGLDEMSMDKRTRNHIIAALEKVQEILEEDAKQKGGEE